MMMKHGNAWRCGFGFVLLIVAAAGAPGTAQGNAVAYPDGVTEPISHLGDVMPPPGSALFDAALCDPPVRPWLQRALRRQTRDWPASPVRLPGVRIVSLLEPIARGAFVAHDALFTANGVGVLLGGRQAASLAARFGLHREQTYSAGVMAQAYVRALPEIRQPAPEQGTVMIVARESRAFPDRTWLSCEFVPVRRHGAAN